MTSYRLDEITPEVLLTASESFRRFPPELHLSDEVKEERGATDA